MGGDGDDCAAAGFDDSVEFFERFGVVGEVFEYVERCDCVD